MKRTRFILAILMLAASMQLVSACASLRGLHGDTPADDAARGAAVGGALGGPAGAAVGALAMGILGAIARQQEKRHLRRKGLLRDQPAPTYAAPSGFNDPQHPIGA